MARTFLFLSAVSGFLAVGLGAFAAHALKRSLSDYSMGVFRTGVEYQFFHTFALALIGLLLARSDSALLRTSGFFFVAGMVIFSGSLYALAFSQERLWGAVTPIGGLSFLIGWGILAFSVSRI